MERRLLIAVLLMVIVAVLPSLFLKPAPRRQAAPAGGDTDTLRHRASESAAPPRKRPPVASLPPAALRSGGAAFAPEVITLRNAEVSYAFSSLGAALVEARMSRYRSFRRDTGASERGGGPAGQVNLVRPLDRWLTLAVVRGADTVRLDSTGFRVAADSIGAVFEGTTGSLSVRLAYAVSPDRPYQVEVKGELGGLEGEGALLLVDLGSGLANVAADTAVEYRYYGLVTRRVTPQKRGFSAFQPGQVTTLDGPFDWVGTKSKYFIAALLSPDSTRPLFGGALVSGGPRVGRLATHAFARVTLPVPPDGRFRYDAYLGPQDQRVLRQLGRQLDKASPYGWVFKPIVMPVATWVTEILLWMHRGLSLAYGWVLIIFGIAVRVALWPLNQRAMRSSVAMQAVQPLMKDIQARHKSDPQRLQQEMVKLYREHKVNPLGGCLPMLLPMPVLLALFFVFDNTIAFRGVPFLWLPDLSRPDPIFVVPAVMGLSMFALTKLGQVGMPPNPQAKMLAVVMPVVMTVVFLNFASGLNLYYAVSNIVSLPQQYLINKARQREVARRQQKASGT